MMFNNLFMRKVQFYKEEDVYSAPSVSVFDPTISSYFSLSSSAFISTFLWTSLSFSIRRPPRRVFVEMQLTYPVFSLAFSPSSS